VIREAKFLISHAPYAVKLDSLMTKPRHPSKQVDGQWVKDPDRTYYGCRIEAAWFRRKSGIVSAHLGTLWDYLDEEPADGTAFLTAATDGRYGGRCIARWDGDSLWAPESTWAQMTAYEEFLRPMLDNYPAVPPGYDGWWTYKTGGMA